MSATYFKNVKVFKKMYSPFANSPEYKDSAYVMVVETAESNVRGPKNALCWHEWIFAIGTYSEIMRKVCSASYEFEICLAQWKPIQKTPEGFIHTCRNIIKNAEEKDTLHTSFNFICSEGENDPINELIVKMGEVEGLRLNKSFGSYALASNDIELIYFANSFVRMCKDNYKNIPPIEFAKEYANRTGTIPFNCPKILNVFKNQTQTI